MSAALKSYVPRPLPAGRGNSAAAPRVVPFPPSQPGASSQSRPHQPVALPPPAPSPALTLLQRLQGLATVVTTSLVALSLISYGASVYLDQQLNQATKHLGRLQRSEQQIATFSAVLKSHTVDQATSDTTALQPPKPDQVIFLKPAPVRSQADLVRSSQGVPVTLGWSRSPLGY
ncbi:MAG: hypothetical protein KGQ93_03525 [Cyanobacteria bacterium REEB459]|nr:hypothetical protein [Cyanobacteria bacterium REEB459]